MIRRQKECGMCAEERKDREDALAAADLALIASRIHLVGEQDKAAKALGEQTLLVIERNHLLRQDIEDLKAKKPAQRKTATAV